MSLTHAWCSTRPVANRARSLGLRQIEAPFFESYVEGDMAAFLRYLEVKRHNAVWGDDPEVQALSEIYNRPAEIWAYDPQVMGDHETPFPLCL